MRPRAALYIHRASWFARRCVPGAAFVWLTAIIALCPGSGFGLHADELVLQSRQSPEESGPSEVLVRLSNPAPRQAVQFDLVYDPAVLRPVQVAGAGRLHESSHLHYSVSPPGILHVLVYDRTGSTPVLETGSDPIVTVSYEILEASTPDTVEWSLQGGLAVEDARASIAIAPATLRIATHGESIPERFALYSNAPNPFSGSTRIRFDVARAGPVRIAIYDVSGKLVRVLANGQFRPGRHSVTWGDGARDARVPPGIYMFVMEAGGFRAVRKAVRID